MSKTCPRWGSKSKDDLNFEVAVVKRKMRSICLKAFNFYSHSAIEPNNPRLRSITRIRFGTNAF